MAEGALGSSSFVLTMSFKAAQNASLTHTHSHVFYSKPRSVSSTCVYVRVCVRACVRVVCCA